MISYFQKSLRLDPGELSNTTQQSTPEADSVAPRARLHPSNPAISPSFRRNRRYRSSQQTVRPWLTSLPSTTQATASPSSFSSSPSPSRDGFRRHRRGGEGRRRARDLRRRRRPVGRAVPTAAPEPAPPLPRPGNNQLAPLLATPVANPVAFFGTSQYFVLRNREISVRVA